MKSKNGKLITISDFQSKVANILKDIVNFKLQILDLYLK